MADRLDRRRLPWQGSFGSDNRRYVNRLTRSAPGCGVGRQGGNSGNLLTRQVRPRGLIGRATAGRLRHVPAGATVIRSDTAFFSSAVIGRRSLVGLASGRVSATGVAAAAVRREEERRATGFAGGVEVPRIAIPLQIDHPPFLCGRPGRGSRVDTLRAWRSTRTRP